MRRRARLLILSLLISLFLCSYIQGAPQMIWRTRGAALVERIAGIECLRTPGASNPFRRWLFRRVEAQVETAFRFNRGEDGKWRVAEIRTGDTMGDVDMMHSPSTSRRQSVPRRTGNGSPALEAFRRERGFT